MHGYLDKIFLVVQWLLLAYGLLFLLAGFNAWNAIEAPFLEVRESLPAGQDYYFVPVWERFVSYTFNGLVALGLSGLLFRLRALYFRRQ